MKLERADIARLRGVPGDWPALTIGDKGLIVYGPNGVGKSSIIDALEKTICGRSSLFKENRADGVNWDDASPHVKGGAPSCTVHGKLNGKQLSITMGSKPANELTDWINAASEASFVLRRYMLLQFIDAQPADRYDQIEPFLNLATFGEFELGLKAMVDAFQMAHVTASAEVSAKEQVIRQTFKLAKGALFARATLLTALEERLKATGLSGASISDLPELRNKVAYELGGQAVSQKLAALGAIKKQAQNLASVSAIRPMYEQVVEAAQKLDDEIRKATQKVSLELLTKAKEHIAALKPIACPVCEQTIDPAKLEARLTERIQESEAVRIATNTLGQRLNSLTKTVGKARVLYSTFKADWAPLDLGYLPVCYANADKLFEVLESLTIANAAQAVPMLDQTFGPAECDPSVQIAKIDAEILRTGGGERRAALEETAAYVATLSKGGAVDDFEALQNASLQASKQKALAARLHAHAEAARKEAVQKSADKIAALANSFYEDVHPGEKIATAKLTVRPTVASSILLNSTFHGLEAPPLKYFSESHLDTLGLCFFLAIRKLEVAGSANFRLLLIDDVLHSVDAEHRTRLAKLLKDHFDDHQIVLVTHDKNFYDRLRATLGSGYNYVAISSWDIDTGPHLSDPSTDLDRVIDKTTRKGKSHDEIAAAGGRFFEWLLKELTERLQVAVFARFTHPHDIGSMWPPLASKLDKHKGFSAAHPGLVQKLNENAWVRNKIGAHHNDQESPVTPKEVEEFVDALAELYKATTCLEKKCGTSIQASKDKKDVWRCACSKLQYTT